MLTAALNRAPLLREIVYIGLSIFLFHLSMLCAAGPREFADLFGALLLFPSPFWVIQVAPYLLLQVARLLLLLVTKVQRWGERGRSPAG